VKATVIINGQDWYIPNGFKSTYRRIAHDPAEVDVLVDLLELVGFAAQPEEIAMWPLRRRVEAEAYAVTEHLIASDNSLRRHPVPDWFPTDGAEPRLVRVPPCAACGEPTSGGHSIHRDGYGIGPEVDLCDACGAGENPTCEELWGMIARRRMN
jgi:hypothetical protein